MDKSFRSELFSLCKKVSTAEYAKKVQKLIHDISVSVESPDKGIIYPMHGSFAIVARQIGREFLGYLFVDDNIGTRSIPESFKIDHLSEDERVLMEIGHRTLTHFVELCLHDISQKSVVVAEIMQPYSLCKPVKMITKSDSFLSDDELQCAVEAFKSGAVYQLLMSMELAPLFEKIGINRMKELASVLEKEIAQSMGEDVSTDIRDFSRRIDSGYKNTADALYAYSVLILSIKSSLALACRLLFGAICGAELFVLNNENIISIEKNVTTIIGQYYKVFSQDMNINLSSIGTEMGNILLLDCDLPSGTHVHEFGMLISKTSNLAGEFGQSAKYSFTTVNEEMIVPHQLVKQIVKIGLPPMGTV